MSDRFCSHCGATRQVGHVICGFCRNPYSADAAQSAITCPRCRTVSAGDQSQCIACGTWLVVQCVFCGGLSAYTKASCVKCEEPFAGSVERKAAQEAEGDDDDAWEEGWAWCSKCQSLVFDEDPAGTCARGGKHDTDDSEAYHLCLDDDELDGQGEFRWCKQCECLFRGNERAGICPATRGPHDGSESSEYFLSRDGDEDEDYGGWRVCRKCTTLFWGEDVGACPGGGGHDGRGSSNWEVFHDDEE